MLNAMQKAAIRHLVAYEFSPPETRLSHDKWCEVAGITTRTLQRWQKESEFKESPQAALDEANDSKDPFASVARQWGLEQLMAVYAKAKTATEKRHILGQILKETEHVATYSEPVDYSAMTDEDLVAMCLNRKVSPAGMTEDELIRLAKGESDGKQTDV
jgi:predicted site-specific integrase-resolvase